MRWGSWWVRAEKMDSASSKSRASLATDHVKMFEET